MPNHNQKFTRDFFIPNDYERKLPMRLLMKMKPVQIGKYQETVEISTKLPNTDNDYYPLAFAHIDTFYAGKGNDNSLYDLLNAGKAVFIDAHLAVLSNE